LPLRNAKRVCARTACSTNADAFFEVRMSGRRGHYRFGEVNAEGTLRLLRDVTVHRRGADEFVAMSGEPAAHGELLTLEPADATTAAAIAVCVVDSRPEIVGGKIRHRLQLKAVDAECADDDRSLASRAKSRRR
jgi:hypothetical protein